ncbi:hypothetical protein Unana1_03512 [Umbelopsis nana]
MECRQFKRKPSPNPSKQTPASSRPSIASVANIQQTISTTRCLSNTSWISCQSRFSSSLSDCPSYCASSNSLVETSGSKLNESNPETSHAQCKDSCGPSLNTASSMASSASDGSECCTPEAQIKNLLWDQTSIQKYAQAVPNDDNLKEIYDTPSKFYYP